MQIKSIKIIAPLNLWWFKSKNFHLNIKSFQLTLFMIYTVWNMQSKVYASPPITLNSYTLTPMSILMHSKTTLVSMYSVFWVENAVKSEVGNDCFFEGSRSLNPLSVKEMRSCCNWQFLYYIVCYQHQPITRRVRTGPWLTSIWVVVMFCWVCRTYWTLSIAFLDHCLANTWHCYLGLHFLIS